MRGGHATQPLLPSPSCAPVTVVSASASVPEVPLKQEQSPVDAENPNVELSQARQRLLLNADVASPAGQPVHVAAAQPAREV